jgi:hypothetical protein
MTGNELRDAAEKLICGLPPHISNWMVVFPWFPAIYPAENCLCLMGDGLPCLKFLRRKNGSWMMIKTQSRRMLRRASIKFIYGKDSAVGCDPKVIRKVFGKSAADMMGLSVSEAKILECMDAAMRSFS